MSPATSGLEDCQASLRRLAASTDLPQVQSPYGVQASLSTVASKHGCTMMFVVACITGPRMNIIEPNRVEREPQRSPHRQQSPLTNKS